MNHHFSPTLLAARHPLFDRPKSGSKNPPNWASFALVKFTA
jgi:hypothetical protein